MKPKTMILMVVAIVCGLGASYMTSRLLAEREEQQPAAQVVAEPVKAKFLVAKTNLDIGSAIKNPQDMFVEKALLAEDAPKDALTEFKLLKGKYLRRTLRKGDHITNDDLMDERASILARLPDGYQAYGIQVDPAAIAAGWAAVPGSKVNILWTRRGSDDKTSYTTVLLEDVLVLAGDGISRMQDDGKALPSSVVTVALKTIDTMKIKLAQQYGPLTLTLRKFSDNTPLPEAEKFSLGDLNKIATDRKEGKGMSGLEVDPNFEIDRETGELIPKLPAAKQDEKVEPLPEVQELKQPKRYFHTIIFRQGDKSWKQRIEVDANGNPIQEDVQQASLGEAPYAQQPDPTVGTPPNNPAQGPPANKELKKGSTKD